MSLTYAPLNAEQRQVRVLQLQQREIHDEMTNAIECPGLLSFEIHTMSLDKRAPFIALSYVWGDASRTREILIEGMSVQVTLNLYDALHWYGHQKLSSTPIWADAICIDQSNLAEKGHQVRFMSCIYKEADWTICWLGPSTPRLEQWVRMNLERGKFRNRLTKLSVEIKKKFSSTFKYKELLRKAEERNGEVEFYGLEYFQRMWTFQESILPQSRALFILDGRPRPFDPRRIPASVSYSIHMPEFIHALGNSRGRHSLKRQILEELRVPFFFDAIGPVSTGMHWHSIEDRNNDRPIENISLHSLLRATSLRACQDQRDKIFALLGIFDRGADRRTIPQTKLLEVDYLKDPDQVFLDALHYIYCEESPACMVDVLIRFKPRHENTSPFSYDTQNRARIPSWLTDMKRPEIRREVEIRSGYWMHPPEEPTTDIRCGESVEWIRLDPKLNKNPNQLRFSAKLLGRVQQILSFPADDKEIVQFVVDLITLAERDDSNNSAQEKDNGVHVQRSADNQRRNQDKLLSVVEATKPAWNGRKAELFASNCLEVRDYTYAVSKSCVDFWRRLEEALSCSSIAPSDERLDSSCGIDTVFQRDARAIMLKNNRSTTLLKGNGLFVLDSGVIGICTSEATEGDIVVFGGAFDRALVLQSTGEWLPMSGSQEDIPYRFIDWASIGVAKGNDMTGRKYTEHLPVMEITLV